MAWAAARCGLGDDDEVRMCVRRVLTVVLMCIIRGRSGCEAKARQCNAMQRLGVGYVESTAVGCFYIRVSADGETGDLSFELIGPPLATTLRLFHFTLSLLHSTSTNILLDKAKSTRCHANIGRAEAVAITANISSLLLPRQCQPDTRCHKL